ncbi:hypothetical protein [Streptomyces canus]
MTSSVAEPGLPDKAALRLLADCAATDVKTVSDLPVSMRQGPRRRLKPQ